jgi:tRNA pseudouridine55 synthase
VDGVLVCDKPAGMTSHDVVARVRRLARQRRVGHGGTLDPPATGVLVLALGRATRLLPFLPMEPKRYLATIAFGAETDTLDASGTVTATADAAGLDEAAVRGALAGFLGPQQQVPPMVSAVKLGGERLYAKARRGESVERVARPIVIHALELVDFTAGGQPQATVAVTCSGGTYVRVLAADLGRALGTLAHLAALRRTAAGRFDERDAHTLAELEALADGRPAAPGAARPAEREAEPPDGPGGLARALLGPAAALASSPVRPLSAAEASALANGATLPPTGRAGPVAAVAPDGRLVAVIQDDAGRARPKVVLG